MCPTSSKRTPKTPLPSYMVKFVVILAIFLSVECAAGSCLSYGHACWGAHGKRSGSPASLSRVDNDVPSTIRDEAKAEWFLSKIISPLDVRFYRDGNELEASKNQPEVDDLFTDLEGDKAKSGTEWDKIREVIKNNRIVLAPGDNGRGVENFLKSPSFLKKRSTTEQ